MKCPKCNYISFDTPERCRNCGYDFSLLSQPAPPVDLPIRSTNTPIGPAPDLPLSSSRRADREVGGSHVTRQASVGASTPGGLDLPLFHEPVPGVDDTPLITSPAPPRAPLAVRRSSDTPRPRTPSATPAATPRLEFTPDPSAFAGRPAPPPIADEAVQHPANGAEPVASPPLARRLGAAAIDALLVGLIDAVVLYFTLKLTGLGAAEVLSLPVLPLLGFFALLNGGYLVGFTTASGQTIGQMMTDVRVVGGRSERVPLGQAIVRTAALVVAIAPLGLGLLPMFLADDGRALHDRLSGTSVRRA